MNNLFFFRIGQTCRYTLCCVRSVGVYAKEKQSGKGQKSAEEDKAKEEKERISFYSKRYDGQENSCYKNKKPSFILTPENMRSRAKTQTNSNTIKNRKSMSPRSPDPHC